MCMLLVQTCTCRTITFNSFDTGQNVLYTFLCSPKSPLCPSVHLVPFPANNFKAIVGIEMKLGLYIDESERKGSAQEP